PFNPATLISYALPQQANVTLEIFTVLGQSVYSIPLKQMPAGFHQEVWNAGGHSSGVYFYRVTVRDPLTGELRFTQTKKMMLIR
ncbi:MAG: T9SS type A sorting domain-containing protein, partial [Bacteroidetes bacterium]|nr:T9SS type A sorting domain-containing protein [Bacteroidota bacterium]